MRMGVLDTRGCAVSGSPTAGQPWLTSTGRTSVHLA